MRLRARQGLQGAEANDTEPSTTRFESDRKLQNTEATFVASVFLNMITDEKRRPDIKRGPQKADFEILSKTAF